MTKTKNKEKDCQEEKEQTSKQAQMEKDSQEAEADINTLLEKAQQDVEDYKNHLQRLQAEFDNYRKRTSDNSISSRNNGICDVIQELLPAIDNLERGIEAVKDKSAKSGMELILKQLKDLLKKFDVCEIKSMGEFFDPDKHHAVAQDEAGDEENQNKVTEVFLKGYQRKTKVLRPAMVKVTK